MMKNIYTILLLSFLCNFLVAQNLKREISHKSETWQERGIQLRAATTPFITTWRTDNAGFTNDNQIKITSDGGAGYDYTVDWGDGETVSGFTGDAIHTYAAIGTYQVKITGIFPAIYLGDPESDANKLISIDQWGDNQWLSMNGAFESCVNMVYKATDVPDLSLADDLFAMFFNAGSFETSLANWDVSTIIDTYYMFSYTDFNQDISAWNVSNVLYMGEMFIGTPFNQDISAWDVSLVTSMYEMFGESDFNQPIGNWNVSNVEDMTGMFRDSPFNQDISSWDVSKVQFMGQMFESSDFSYDIGNWQTLSLQEMDSIFYDARNFNYDLGNWNISAVYDLASSLDLSGVNVSNYDKTLKGWAAQTVLPTLTFNGAGLTYCASSAARGILIAQGWIFNGDNDDCTPVFSYDFVDGSLSNYIPTEFEAIATGAKPSFNRFGEEEQAYFFNGIDNFLEVSNSNSIAAIKQAVSISAWIRPENFEQNYYTLFTNFDGDNGFYAYYERQSKDVYRLFIYVLEQGETRGVLTVDDVYFENEWYHIAITTDQDNGIKFYVNTELVAENLSPFEASASSSNKNYTIGYSEYWEDEYFSGAMDDIRVYDYELGLANIQYNYDDNGGPFLPYAYYPFDGNYDEASGNGKNPVSTNTPGFTGNRFFEANKALNLAQGATDFLTYDWTLDPNQTFSISVWVKWQGGADFQEIVSWWDAGATTKTYLGVADNGNIRFGDAYTETSIPMPVGRWTHLVAVFDQSQSQLYLDNELVASQQGTSYEFGAFTVGSLQNGSELWNGAIDDLRIYTRPLNAYLVNDLFKENGFGKRPQTGPANAQLINTGPNFIEFNYERAQEEVDGYIAVRSLLAPVNSDILSDGLEYDDYALLNESDVYVVPTILDTLINDFNGNFPLSANTDYFYRVWSYNGDGVSRKYGNVSTTFSTSTTSAYATDFPKNLRVIAKSDNQATITFDPSTDAAVTSYMVIISETNKGLPILFKSGKNGINYTNGDTFGNQTVVSTGLESTITVTDLASETVYELTVVAKTGNENSASYRYSSSFSNFSFSTLAEEPTNSTTNLTIENRTSNGFSARFDEVLSGNNERVDSTFIVEVEAQNSMYFINFTFDNPAPNQFYVNTTLNQYLPRVEIRFGDDKSQNAHRTVANDFVDYINVPFEVWDIDNNVQLNISFNDTQGNGVFDLNTDATAEYIAIHNSIYDEATPDPTISSPTINTMYLFWPRIIEGQVWNTNDIPDFSIRMGYYYNEQENYLVLRSSEGPITEDPLDGKGYSVGDLVGGAAVVLAGRSTEFIEIDLAPATTYNYGIYTVAGDGLLSNYRTVDPLVTEASTLSLEPATQATGLTFVDVSFTGIGVNFNTNQENSTGYLVVSRIDVEVDFVPVDGQGYDVDEFVGGNDDQQILGNSSSNSLSHNGLTSGDTYFYKVFSFNGSGISTNYFIDNPLSGNKETLVDNTAPIQGTVAYSQTAEVGEQVEVSVVVTDTESGLDAVNILYLTSDVGNYAQATSSSMQRNGSTYSFILPSMTVKGLEFKIAATNKFGLVSESEVGAIRASVTGQGVSIPYSSFGSDQSNYRIISVPFQLSNSSISAVFGSAFGGVDDSKWRMYRYQNGSTAEVSTSGSLSVGSGYWLIASESATFSTGAGTTIASSTIRPVTITLKPGWNQIGNPYTYDVPWSLIQGVNDISFALRVFNGSWTNGTSLKAFSGGFVNNTTASDIIIEVPTSQSAATIAIADNDNILWRLPIEVVSNGMVNTFGGIGMKSQGSKVTVSDHDYSLPRLEKYLELNHENKLRGFAATMSINDNASSGSWKFTIDNNLNDPTLELRWSPALIDNLQNDVYLWDEQKGIAIDMKSVNQYSFNNGLTNSFHVFYGDPSFILENTQTQIFRLYDPYPNPSDGKLTISFNVPQDTFNEAMLLQIYDSKGVVVNEQTINDFQPGVNLFELNIKSTNLVTSNGIYYLRLVYNGAHYLKKIVIKN